MTLTDVVFRRLRAWTCRRSIQRRPRRKDRSRRRRNPPAQTLQRWYLWQPVKPSLNLLSFSLLLIRNFPFSYFGSRLQSFLYQPNNFYVLFHRTYESSTLFLLTDQLHLMDGTECLWKSSPKGDLIVHVTKVRPTDKAARFFSELKRDRTSEILYNKRNNLLVLKTNFKFAAF